MMTVTKLIHFTIIATATCTISNAALVLLIDPIADTLAIEAGTSDTLTTVGNVSSFNLGSDWLAGSVLGEDTPASPAGQIGLINIAASTSLSGANFSLRFFSQTDSSSDPVDSIQILYGPGQENPTIVGNGTAISYAGADARIVQALDDIAQGLGPWGTEFSLDDTSFPQTSVDLVLPTPVPEPASAMMMGAIAITAGIFGRRRRR